MRILAIIQVIIIIIIAIIIIIVIIFFPIMEFCAFTEYFLYLSLLS